MYAVGQIENQVKMKFLSPNSNYSLIMNEQLHVEDKEIGNHTRLKLF